MKIAAQTLVSCDDYNTCAESSIDSWRVCSWTTESRPYSSSRQWAIIIIISSSFHVIIQTVLSKRIQIDPRLSFFSLFSKCPHVSKRPQQPDKTCQQHSSLISMYYKQLTTYINLLALFYLSRWLWTDLVLSKFHFLIPGNQRMKWIICCWMMEDSSFYMASDRIVIIVIQRMIVYNTWTKVFTVGRFWNMNI
jgi:hypothetical protein